MGSTGRLSLPAHRAGIATQGQLDGGATDNHWLNRRYAARSPMNSSWSDNLSEYTQSEETTLLRRQAETRLVIGLRQVL